MDFGLWIDDPWRLIRTDEYWEKLAGLGVQTADLMIDSSKRRWDLQYKLPAIELFCRLAIDHDIEPVVLGWPTPRVSVIDAMCADFDRIGTMGVAAFGLDTEMTWGSDDLDGTYPGLAAAARETIERLREIGTRHDVRLELTTHMGHREATSRATLAPFVDRVYYQSYSTRHDWRGNEVRWNDRLAPGRRQASDIARVRRQVPGVNDGSVQLCIGQALYAQKWPGHSVDQALGLALDATRDAGITSIRGWSSKWVVGVKSGTAVQQAVTEWVRRTFGP